MDTKPAELNQVHCYSLAKKNLRLELQSSCSHPFLNLNPEQKEKQSENILEFIHSYSFMLLDPFSYCTSLLNLASNFSMGPYTWLSDLLVEFA